MNEMEKVHEEKAKQIVEMFYTIIAEKYDQSLLNFQEWLKKSCYDTAKQCAMIYVDGKIECLDKITSNPPMRSEITGKWMDTDIEILNWKTVKSIIEKL